MSDSQKSLDDVANDLAALLQSAGHPLRLRLLVAAGERKRFSASELQTALEGPTVGTISYHLRQLHDAGVLHRAGQRQVRGAIEHFYRLSPLGCLLLDGVGMFESWYRAATGKFNEDVPLLTREDLDRILAERADGAPHLRAVD